MQPAPYREGLHPYSHDRYVLKKPFFNIGSKLQIFDPNGLLILFVQRKIFVLKEDIKVFSDESMSQQMLAIKARHIIDFSAAYDVFDSQTGEKVGAFRRRGWTSMVRDNWEVLDVNDMMIGEIIEDSLALALVRRFLENLIPQSFDINTNAGKVADLSQRFNPFLFSMSIEFSMDVGRTFDRRMGLAAAILIAVIEGRQRG